MTGKRVSDETEQLMNKWYDEGLPVSEIAIRADVRYLTAYFHTKLKRRINPESGKPFESLKQYYSYLARRRKQPINQVPIEQPISQEQKDLEAPLIAALWSLARIRPPTKIGYNDFAALFVLAKKYKWGGQVFPSDISQALNANFFTPEDARLQPQGLGPYFERLKQLGLIQGTSETGYTIDRGLVRIIFDNFDRYVTPGLTKERFWSSVSAWYRLD